MAALTAGMSRPGATADLGPGGQSAARTSGPAERDRSTAVSSGTRPVRSWPLLVLAAPAAAEVWTGWVGIAQKTGVRAGLPAAGHLAVAAPGHINHLARRRGGVRGVRGVRAARLAGRWAFGQRQDPPVRQVVRDLLLRARHGRAGGLPPAGPGRDGTGTVARHHDRVLPAGPGPGHGDRAGAHAPRRCRHRSRRTGQRNRTSSIAVPSLVRRGPGWGGPGPDRIACASSRPRSFRTDQASPAASPRRQAGNSNPVRHQPGTGGRQQADSSGKAGIQTGSAQRGWSAPASLEAAMSANRL